MKSLNKMMIILAVVGLVSSVAQASDSSWVESFKSVVKEKWSELKSYFEVKTQAVVRVAQPALPASPKLAKTKSGVAYIEGRKLAALKKMKVPKIPLLDIGREEELAGDSFKLVLVDKLPDAHIEPVQELSSIPVAGEGEVKQWLGEEIQLAPPALKFEIPALDESKKVTLEKVETLTYKADSEKPVQPLAVMPFTDEYLKMLRALILYEKKDLCHQAAGLLHALSQSKNEDVRLMANHHLGQCLHEMNLPEAAVYFLSRVIKSEDPRFLKTAVQTELQENQLRLEDPVAETLLGLKNRGVLTAELESQEAYWLAKYFVRRGNATKALQFAEKVSHSDKNYFKAQYVAAVAEYLLGKAQASLDHQKNLVKELTQSNADRDVLALANLNLGRFAFQKGLFKEAVEAFQRVPKEHPLWMQALIELGWTQLQNKDAAGAIGNMHSIQSPYFDGAYKAESYVVRTIGYLDICQYGDAYRTAGMLDDKYGPWAEKMTNFMLTHKDPAQYYGIALKYLAHIKSTQDVDGLPYQVIREIARQKDFLNAQEAVNGIVDEEEGYGLIYGLLEKDKKAITWKRAQVVKRINELKSLLQKAYKKPELAKNINPWKAELKVNEEFFEVYTFKLDVLAESENDFKPLKEQSTARLAQNKTHWKGLAGAALKAHIKRLNQELGQLLANNELLRYEVYAGSGENIRAQMVGQKVQAHGVANASEKSKWDFDGEFWEDEIGNYRSSLKNNCLNNGHVAQE